MGRNFLAVATIMSLLLLFCCFVDSSVAAESAEYSLSDGETVEVGGYTYTASGGSATVSVSGDVLTLIEGPLLVPSSASFVVGSYTYQADGGDATVSVSSGVLTLVEGYLQAPDGASFSAGSCQYAASGDSVSVCYSGEVMTHREGNLQIPDGASVLIANTTYTSNSSETVLGASLSTDNVTLFSGAVTPGDYYSTVMVYPYTERVDYAKSISIEDRGLVITIPAYSEDNGDVSAGHLALESLGETGITTDVHNGSYSDDLVICVTGDSYTVESGYSYLGSDAGVTVNGVTVNLISYDESLRRHAGTTETAVLANEGQSITFTYNQTSLEYQVGANDTLFTVGSNGIVSLSEGNVTVPAESSVIIGDATYTAGTTDASVSYSSTGIQLLGGILSFDSGCIVIMESTYFTAGNDGATLDADIGALTAGSADMVADSTTSVVFEDAENDVTITIDGASSITVNGNSATVTVDAGYTVIFTDNNSGVATYEISDGSSASFGYSSTDGAFLLTDGAYKLSDRGTVEINGVTITLDVADSSYSYAWAATGAVTAYQGQILSFDLGESGTQIYTVAANNSEFTSTSASAVLVAGSVTLDVGEGILVGAYTYAAPDNSSAVISVTEGAITLESGSLTVPDGAPFIALSTEYVSGDQSTQVSLADSSITLDSGTLTFTGASTVVANGITFTVTGASSSVTLSYGNNMGISISSGSGLSVTYGSTTYSYTLSSASFEVSFYTVDSVTSARSVLSSGSVTLGYGSEVWVQKTGTSTSVEYLRFTPAASGSTATVDVTSGTALSMTAGSAVTVTDVTGFTYGNAGTDALSLLVTGEDSVTLQSGTVSVSAGSAATLTAGSTVLTTGTDGATVRYYDGAIYLLGGEIVVTADGTQVVANGITYALANGTAVTYSDSGLVLGTGTLAFTGASTITAGEIGFAFTGGTSSVTFVYDNTLSFSIASGSGLSITYGSMTYSYALSSASFSVSLYESGSAYAVKAVMTSGLATVGNSSQLWVPYASASTGYLTFSTSSDGAATVDTSLEVTLSSGSVTVTDSTGYTYTNAGSENLEFTVEGEDSITLESGTVSVPVGASVILGENSVSNTYGSFTLDSEGVVTAADSATVNINDTVYNSELADTVLTVTEDGTVALTYGTISVAYEGVLYVGTLPLTVDPQGTTLNYDGSKVTLENGGVSVTASTALTVGGVGYTLAASSAMYSNHGAASLTAGSVSVSGAFSLTVNDIGLSLTGSSAASTVAYGDLVSFSTSSAEGLQITCGSTYTFTLDTAVFSIGTTDSDSSDSQVAKPVLASGSATLGTDAAVWVQRYGSEDYIRFDGATSSGAVTVGATDSGPRVTVAQGAVNLTTRADPTYTNAGSGSLVFLANDEDDIALESGTVSIPEGASVTVNGIKITNTSGTVTVTDAGVVTVSAGSLASVVSESESYVIDNTSGTSDMTEDVVQRESMNGRSRYADEKAWLLTELTTYQEDAYNSTLLNLVTQTYEAIEDRVYDSSLSYDENVSAVYVIYEEFVQQWEETYSSADIDFAAYKETALAKIDRLHKGETSLTEKRLIDNAYSLTSAVVYDENLTLKKNQAVIDTIVSSANSSLAYYRGAPDSAFGIYKSVMTGYIEEEEEDGLTVIATTKAQYVTILENLQYLYSQSQEENLARVDQLVASFDSAVYQFRLTSFNGHKSEITTELSNLSGTYCEPEAKECIAALQTQLENYAYDRSVLYSDNINRLDNLLVNLKSNISAALSGNLSTFDNFCDKYYDLYTSVIGKYSESGYKGLDDDTRTEILAAITAARDKVDTTSSGRLAYDHSKTLAENINAVHAIATDLSKKITQITSEELNNALEETYNAALDHFSKNDVDGVPTKLRETISEYRDQVVGVYEDGTKDISTKGTEINAIMTEYDSVMAPLIAQAEFYLNVDEGEKFLREEYGTAGDTVEAQMEVLIAQLRALTYDTTKTMEDNLASLKGTIDGYSQELAVLKYNTVKGNFENYRDHAAWTVSQFQGDESSDEVKALVAQFCEAISSLEYNGKSLYSNKLAVDNLYDEFEGKYDKLRFEEIRAEYVSEFETDMANISLEDAKSRAAEFLSTLKDYVYDEDADNFTFLEVFHGDCAVCFEYLKTESLEVSTDVSSDSNAYFVERRDLIAATVPLTEAAIALRDSTVSGINMIIADSAYTQPGKAEAIYQLDAAFYAMMDLDDRLSQVIELINAESLMDQSDAVSSMIAKYAGTVSGYTYDPSLSVKENIAAVDAIYWEFIDRIEAQRLLENTVVVGNIQPSGKAVDGTDAEYPEGSSEIWGTVSNLNGLGSSASISISTATPATIDGDSIIPAAGSSVDFLADGRVIGAFEIKIYNSGEEITDFSGNYLVRILLPEGMRGQYTSVQVAYVDEYGDVQVHEAKVVGNYLEFYTTHFSLFTLIGAENITSHYDIYAYLAIAAIVILMFAYVSRLVRYDANGGIGSTPAQFFVGSGEGPVSANGFAREGYRFAGWSRTPDGPAGIGAGAQLDELGKFHSIKLFAIWEKEAD